MKPNKRIWARIFDRWSSLNVPSVSVIDFEMGHHFHDIPWIELATGLQLECRNPQVDTARGILSLSESGDDNLLAAFQIEAYCKHMEILANEQLEQTIRLLYPSVRNHWSHNAKVTLPYLDDSPAEGRKPHGWQETVDRAAETWTRIAEEYSVIRIPKFMDFNSEEYGNWQAYIQQFADQQEHAQYQRLKAKFETSD